MNMNGDVRPGAAALLEVRDLVVDYPLPRRIFGRRRAHRAVDHVSFDIAAGETLGLVGESGSGKSTIGRAILGLLRPAAGTITFDGVELTAAPAAELRRLRPDIQVVFQNPYASLNPALTIGDAIGEPIHVHQGLAGQRLADAVSDLLRLVGLDPAMAARYPRAFSGGQRQRIAVARAMALHPRLLIADEPVSALDVSTRGQIINLLEDLSHDMGLADLFIGHDLAVVRHISDRIAVLYRGQLVELGPADEVADRPHHPYTQKLVAAVPVPDPAEQARRRAARPVAVSSGGPDEGCPFAPRCPHRMDRCVVENPAPRLVDRSVVRCHLYPETTAAALAPPNARRLAGVVPEITVVATSEQAGVLAATRLLDRLAAADPERSFFFACPAGRTPMTTYAALGRLASERGADLSRLVIAMIDEYVVEGVDGFVVCDPGAHYSCRRQLSEGLLRVVNARLPPGRRVNTESILLPDPSDPGGFDELIEAAGGIDVFLLATGATDGHVAFNPPGTALDSDTRVVALARSTRRDNMATFPGFERIDDVPAFGVTVGLRTITRSRETMLMVLGEDKAEAYARLVRCDGFDPAWPASVIFECAAPWIIVDTAAAGTRRDS
jgi:oligopeptide/dipeptide ABC transporter ATP-binding protein